MNTTNQKSSSTQKTEKNTHVTSRPKGKSQYAQKTRSKKTKPVVKPSGPVNTYTSVCCQLPAAKPRAFSPIAGKKDKTGLGKWRCSGCGKVTKVTVSKFRAPEVTAEISNEPSI